MQGCRSTVGQTGQVAYVYLHPRKTMHAYGVQLCLILANKQHAIMAPDLQKPSMFIRTYIPQKNLMSNLGMIYCG